MFLANIFYKRFGYSPYKQWYWALRIDLIQKVYVKSHTHYKISFFRTKLWFDFFKYENKVWDLNILLQDLINQIDKKPNPKIKWKAEELRLRLGELK